MTIDPRDFGINRHGNRPVLSLFSGAGGLDHGFLKAGYQPIVAIDNNPAALDTYKSNNPRTSVIQMDLARADPHEVIDIWERHSAGASPLGIIGGPPCQGFSSANVRQKNTDPRHQLVFNYASIVDAFETRYGISFFAFENVPGLTRRRYKALFADFETKCGESGFNVESAVVDAGTFGIAQNRKRLVVIGINKNHFPDVRLKFSAGGLRPLNVDQVLAGLPEPAFCAKNLKPQDIPHHPNHVTMNPRSRKFTDGSLTPGYGTGLSFKVLAWDAPSYTVAYGHNEVHIHPNCHRRLSVYESDVVAGISQRWVLPQGNIYRTGSVGFRRGSPAAW